MPRFGGKPVDQADFSDVQSSIETTGQRKRGPRFGGRPFEPPRAAAPAQPVQVEDPSFLGQLSRQAGLFGRNIIRAGYGLSGIVSDPITQGINLATGGGNEAIPRQATASEAADYLADRLGLPTEASDAERLGGAITRNVASAGVPIGLGQYAARTGATLAPTVGTRIGEMLAAAPRAQVAGAALGAGASEGTRMAGGGEVAQTVAGLAGGLAPGIAPRVARTAIPNVDRRAAQIIQREAGPAGLEGQASTVPGVRRTLGEETQNPAIMALENTARAGFRGTFDPIDLQNNAARVQALENIAGTPAQRLAAEEARDAATTDLRNQAFAEGRQAQAASAGQRALTPGATQESGLTGLRTQLESAQASQGGRTAVQRSLGDVLSALRGADDSVEGLYRVRKTINDLLEGKAGSEKGYAKAATSELLDARRLVDQEISTRAPSFAGYIEAYKQGSRPINRMEVGRELLESGSAGIRDVAGTPRLTPGTFAKAEDLDPIAQRATGFKNARAEDILTPEDISAIRGIQDDLRREFARQRSATAGSQTFERGEVTGRALRRGSRLVPYVGDLISYIDDRATDRVKERLAYLIANPAEARRVVNSLKNAEDRSAVNRIFLQLQSRMTDSEEEN